MIVTSRAISDEADNHCNSMLDELLTTIQRCFGEYSIESAHYLTELSRYSEAGAVFKELATEADLAATDSLGMMIALTRQYQAYSVYQAAEQWDETLASLRALLSLLRSSEARALVSNKIEALLENQLSHSPDAFALKLELLNADFTRERADELIALAKHLEEYNTAIELLQRCLRCLRIQMRLSVA